MVNLGSNPIYGSRLSLQSLESNEVSIHPPPCQDLTDVTLANEYTNSILTDNASRAIQGNIKIFLSYILFNKI